MNITTSLHDRITEAFIEENPVDVILTERRRVATTSGGYRWEEVGPRSPQKARLIIPDAAGSVRHTEEGRVVLVEGILVLKRNAQVEIGDLWKRSDSVWEVFSIGRVQNWSVNAEMKRYG